MQKDSNLSNTTKGEKYNQSLKWPHILLPTWCVVEASFKAMFMTPGESMDIIKESH